MVTVQDLKDILIDTINDIDNYDLLDRIINYIDVQTFVYEEDEEA